MNNHPVFGNWSARQILNILPSGLRHQKSPKRKRSVNASVSGFLFWSENEPGVDPRGGQGDNSVLFCRIGTVNRSVHTVVFPVQLNLLRGRDTKTGLYDGAPGLPFRSRENAPGFFLQRMVLSCSTVLNEGEVSISSRGVGRSGPLEGGFCGDLR